MPEGYHFVLCAVNLQISYSEGWMRALFAWRKHRICRTKMKETYDENSASYVGGIINVWKLNTSKKDSVRRSLDGQHFSLQHQRYQPIARHKEVPSTETQRLTLSPIMVNRKLKATR